MLPPARLDIVGAAPYALAYYRSILGDRSTLSRTLAGQGLLKYGDGTETDVMLDALCTEQDNNVATLFSQSVAKRAKVGHVERLREAPRDRLTG